MFNQLYLLNFQVIKFISKYKHINKEIGKSNSNPMIVIIDNY
jgi:hypothetical protein